MVEDEVFTGGLSIGSETFGVAEVVVLMIVLDLLVVGSVTM
jgi:hypothetical protein